MVVNRGLTMQFLVKEPTTSMNGKSQYAKSLQGANEAPSLGMLTEPNWLRRITICGI